MPTVTRARRWATVQKGAEYLGISTSSMRRMIAAGEIPAYRYSERLVRVDLNELDAQARPAAVDAEALVLENVAKMTTLLADDSPASDQAPVARRSISAMSPEADIPSALAIATTLVTSG